jgi:type IV pilus assembly protein PilN
MVGYAQSNARVSTLMRNIESSPVVTHPDLVEGEARAAACPRRARGRPKPERGGPKVSEFTLNFQVTRVRAAD